MSDSPHAPSPRAAGVVDFLGYGAFVGLQWLFRLLPLAMVARFGALAGMGFLACSGSYRRLVARNLKIAFGTEMDARARRALLWQSARRMGANLACSLKLPGMDKDAVAPHVSVDGLEHVEAAAAGGRGVVLVVAHMGPWELFTHTRAYLPEGREAGAVYQALSNPLLDARVRASREQMHHHLFGRSEGFAAASALLRRGGLVGVLSDQHAGDVGIFTPFFGRLASTTSLPLLLARKARIQCVVLGIETIAPAQWRIHARPIELPSSVDVAASLPLVNQALEAMIRRSPADWFWVHNRWKTPDPAFLLGGQKRGWVAPDPAALQPFRILVRAPNWLGDACMAVPALRAIKRGRPDARLTVLTPTKLADFWRTVPEIDAVLTRDGGESVFAVARKVRAAGGFDVGVLLPNSVRAALEMKFGGVPRVVGYASTGRGWLLDRALTRTRTRGPVRHHVEHYLRIAGICGADISDPTLVETQMLPTVAPAGPLRIGLCAGAEYGPAKRWPAESFVDMAELVNARTGRPVEWVLVGTAAEAPLGRQLEDGIGGNCRNLIGKTTLAQLIDELRACALLVTNDTGTMHLAALLGVPVVAIFGSTEPAWTGPLGSGHTILREHVECSPCFLRTCPLDFRCMHAIPPDRVADAVLRALPKA